MTRQDFDKYLDELTSETGFDLTKEQKAFAYQAAKKYHEQVLRIHDVSGRSEQLKGDEHKSAEWRSKNLGYGSKGEMCYIK